MAGPGASEVAEMMAGVPYFDGLSDKTRKAIAKEGRVISYEAGRTIVDEGGAGVGFYLVLEGKVEVRKSGRVLATLGKGQFFGEMSVIDGQPRSADVVAVTATQCWVLVSWNFAGMLKGHPEVALPMLKELVRRLRAAQSAPAS